MKFGLDTPTLKLHPPMGRTFAISLPMLLMVFALLEGLARIPAIQHALPSPSQGSGHDALNIKLDELDHIAASHDVPCLVVGNSMVNAGVLPDALSEGYQHETGQPLSCYNFGLIGFTASDIGEWAPILVHRYHPRLLIFGTTARDYSERMNPVMDIFAVHTPWARYQRGEFNIEGWLTDQSYAYRYYLRFRAWPTPDFLTRVFGVDQPLPPPRQSDRPRVDITKPPVADQGMSGTEGFHDYAVASDDLAGLVEVLHLKQEGVEVVLFEIPYSPNYLGYFDHGEADYQQFFDAVSAEADRAGVPLISKPAFDLIPLEGWHDYNHLNEEGAAIYSRWLGKQIGGLVEQGILISLDR